MTSINYNEFQAGQGVSAPALNENFTLTNNAIENLEVVVNSAVTSLTSTTLLKANKNGSSSETFSVANATENTHAVNLGQLNSFPAVNPVGSIIWFAGTSIPAGYLLCDGRAVSRTTYATLFSALGTKYGAGDSSTTFNLPNLINKFIQGSATAGTISSTSGSTSSNGNHSHSCPSGSYPSETGSAGAHTHTLNMSNMTLMPCVKC
ncbi:MAG: phage tail protein [Candidatus Gastranaerophilales bacterium]|nr:phage tail protein [Candidatus Gastranaerophilales bacterium]